ncbi:MAG: hypothetical protein GC159_16595 [Phycisphaera sp.]|nr:hypothetical protein [Phycisphaera sp.]
MQPAQRQTAAVLLVVCCVALNFARASDSSKPPRALMADFSAASDASARKAALDAILAGGDEKTIRAIAKVVDSKLTGQEKKYADLLAPKIRDAYLKRLAGLSDEQVLLVVKTRRMWKGYLLNGGDIEGFRESHLKPVWEMKDFLLPKIEDISDDRVQAMRAELVEYGEYQAACNSALGIEPDPTTDKKSPTGIPYQPLDQPPTFLDNLKHLERSLLLGYSVASDGGRKVLMMNDGFAREIDVQEAEFVMFCNEVRMLTGTIAWRIDPLGCAVERDHSTDRADGKASGHMSTVPGKHGFTDRNKRMGATFFNSEGAGGGKDGRDYANQLSYGGGHTGPLYSLKRNCVGVGRRKGVYTSQYRFDKAIVHPCPATSDELWMPPGVEAADIRSGDMKRVYLAMKSGAFGPAKKALTQMDPKQDLDIVLKKFFTSAVDIEVDWLVNSIAEIEKTGDLYAAAVRLAEARKQLAGIDGVDDKLSEMTTRLSAKENRDAIQAGETFYRVINSGQSGDALLRLLGQYYQRYKDTDYGQAIKAAQDDAEKKKQWSDYFLAKNPHAASYDYPAKQ